MPVRLFGTEHANYGELQILVDGRWGTVCDDNWTNVNTDVVCLQLGYNDGGTMSSGSDFATYMPVHMDEVNTKSLIIISIDNA